MRVLIKNKTSFNTIEYDNVTSISFANNTYTIVHGGTTTTYSAANYLVSLLYQQEGGKHV